MSKLSSIIINGIRFLGGNVRTENGKVFVDGNRIDLGNAVKIDIVVHGNLESLDVGSAQMVQVNGSVGRLKTASGDVKCGEVHGDVSTASGDVECGDVRGSVGTTSGDVQARSVAGNVKTVSGDVSTRRS